MNQLLKMHDRMGIKLLDVLNNAVGMLNDKNKRIKKEMSRNGN